MPPQLIIPLVSASLSSIAGAVAVVVTRLSAQRTERIRMRLAAELDREHTQLVMRAHDQPTAGNRAVAVWATAGGMSVMSWPIPAAVGMASDTGRCGYVGLMNDMSEAGMRLLAEIVQDRFNGPRILYDRRAAGQICDADLRGLIPDTWLYVDWPERIIGADKWVRLFRAAGFLSSPYGLPQPTSAITLYRGATTERRVGMSWTPDINRADQFRQRHSWHAPTVIYRTVAEPEAVLALLERRGEGPPEAVVDPQMLTVIDQLGPLHPQRHRDAG